MRGWARALGTGLWLAIAAPATAQPAEDPFGHPKHAKLFPRCETCHLGAARAGQSLMPEPTSCAECHDGAIQERVPWRSRTTAAPSNLRFDHLRHATAAGQAARRTRAELPTCVSCHQPNGQGWMQTRRTIVARCLDCHRLPSEHLATADTACASCHLPLSEAKTLPDDRVKGFPVPISHRQPTFLPAGPRGHGNLAKTPGGGIAASCSTCHARDFCVACHVNAPETAPIQALAPDSRSLLHKAELAAPVSHRAADFDQRHGQSLGGRAETCATCHTRESCLACHAATPPPAARALPTAGPGRGRGAPAIRKRPLDHTLDFGDRHAAPATAASPSCAACHPRTQCLECHRPDPARSSGFHPTGFLTRHPAAAYSRETSCADCHNVQQFCASCHVQAGTTAKAPLGVGSFHDAKRFFLAGHGQAARQSLESCVSCHAERDCLPCHSALGGRRFSPHGPGFDPARLRRRNPEMCAACHGVSIPNRDH